jgi:hypothetical protein
MNYRMQIRTCWAPLLVSAHWIQFVHFLEVYFFRQLARDTAQHSGRSQELKVYGFLITGKATTAIGAFSEVNPKTSPGVQPNRGHWTSFRAVTAAGARSLIDDRARPENCGICQIRNPCKQRQAICLDRHWGF